MSHAPTQPIAEPKNGFGITALVLGIVAIPFGFIPLTGFLALILGVLAVLFAFLGWGRARKGRATNKKMNYFAGVIGAAAIALGIWGLTIMYSATEEFVNDMNETTGQFERDMQGLNAPTVEPSTGSATEAPTSEPPATEAPSSEADSVEPVAPPTYEPDYTTPEAPEPTEPEVPVELQNATSSAQSYLEYTAFSKSGLIDQLKFGGYSEDVATKAVESLGINWKAEAVESAKSYLEYTSFSKSGLIDQLEFSGFTQAQAEYAADQVY